MLAYQIVAGFSEIKSELRKQFSPTKNLKDLHLWFSFEENVLYAHDYQDHEKCIALAANNKSDNTWQITFSGGTYGKVLINYVIEIINLTQEFLKLYRLHGYFTLR